MLQITLSTIGMFQSLASFFGSYHSFPAPDIQLPDFYDIFAPEYSAEFYIRTFSRTPYYRQEW
jgi:hypothetical protein